ncbi:MAG: hypothetical protein A49_07890 [Methyloceanibacter sp.]|nr:MAG: hypothetical protein A49_07890 [Methyloceanibacter sp.]
MFALSLFPDGFGGLSVAGAVGIATGLALIAAMPGGSASNLLTFLGNGNVALSVSLTAITTFACLLATPVVLASLVTVQVPGEIDIDKSRIMLDIGLFLIAPLLAGMVVHACTNDRQRVIFVKFMVRASLGLLALIIVGSLGAGRLKFAAYGWLGPAAVIVFCIGAVVLARLFAHVCGTVERDTFAIVIEVAVKNGLLALLVLTSMFPNHMLAEAGPDAYLIAAARDGCMFVVLFFSGVAWPRVSSRRFARADSWRSRLGRGSIRIVREGLARRQRRRGNPHAAFRLPGLAGSVVTSRSRGNERVSARAFHLRAPRRSKCVRAGPIFTSVGGIRFSRF